MKAKALKKRLTFNKETIVNLKKTEMKEAYGGETQNSDVPFVACDTCVRTCMVTCLVCHDEKTDLVFCLQPGGGG